jgi:hypothetical protein
MSNQIHFSGGFITSVSTGSLSFAPPAAHKINSYRFDINEENSVQVQDLQVESDENGKCKAALYSSGTFVRHNELYSIVRSPFNTIWLGDRFGGWHPLD